MSRDRLPWRTTRDPWFTLIAELMLAQTQVERVAPRFLRFIDRFPTPHSLAVSTPREVLELWVGLGYNRRALYLQESAKQIEERFEGVVPHSLSGLLSLPGVGPYTARAVLAFAFGDDVGVVDTNTGRVLARAFVNHLLAPSGAQALADAVVPGGEGRKWNLALMDLGSLVCRLREPDCAHCPLRAGSCRFYGARREGSIESDDPARSSHGVSRPQARFAGSDREGRGRLLRAAIAGTIVREDLAAAAGWPEEPLRAERVAARLVVEGLLAQSHSGDYQLP